MNIELRIWAILFLGALWGGLTTHQILCNDPWYINFLLLPLFWVIGGVMSRIAFLAKLGFLVKSKLNKNGDSVTVRCESRYRHEHN